MVLQEPFIFPYTVAENIAYGRPDAPMDKIEAAACAANLRAAGSRDLDRHPTRILGSARL